MKKKPPPETGYSDAAKLAVQETSARVKEMHKAIADQSFDVLTRIPLIAGPAALVRTAHDAIAGGVYAAIHHGSGGLLGAASMVERNLPENAGEQPPGQIARSMRSALNAAFGDHLAQTGNVLAIEMGIYHHGRQLAIERDALAAAFPAAGRRLCVFIHGLAFDEHCWQPADAREIDFARELHAEFGYTSLYVRYNTGLPIADNGARLSALLEELAAAWPETVDDLLLIGHSMGGLVAREACELAAGDDLHWPQLTSMLICLGSPHLGSPVERLGHAVNTALDRHAVTAPLGKIAAIRSQGVKDLRHGPGASPETPHAIALRFLGGTLTDDVDHPLAGWFGDGLVTMGSATDHPVTGDVKSARIGGIAHMALVTEPRVFAQIRDWLAEAGAASDRS
jgi:pimeloyl-ACP methyl ester carboxylesterase